jgi:hypothetical protein
MRCVGQVIHMGGGEAHTGCSSGKTEGKRSLGRQAGDGRVISKWIFKK